MKKLALAVAITTSATASSGAFALLYPYDGYAISGKAGAPLASIEVTAAAPLSMWYVNSTSTASNKTAPAIQMNVSSSWAFDFTNPAAVSFTGTLHLGSFRTQSYIGGVFNTDGRQNYSGVMMSFSGVGSYNEATKTFTYNFMNSTVNGGGASVYSATAGATCVNGRTYILGKVCDGFLSTSKAWEGLALNFVFSEERRTFAGSLQGTDTSGTGVSANVTRYNWQIQSNPYPFPIPASAWLFGSGLLGLTGASRYRRKRAGK